MGRVSGQKGARINLLVPNGMDKSRWENAVDDLLRKLPTRSRARFVQLGQDDIAFIRMTLSIWPLRKVEDPVIKMISDDTLRERMRPLGLPRVWSFGWDRAAEGTLKVFKRALAQ